MKKKKTLKLATILCALVLALAACAQPSAPEQTPVSPTVAPAPTAEPTVEPTQTAAKTHVNVAALKGPTGIGMVELMERAKNADTQNEYSFTLVNSPDEITALISSGDADIAAAPSNLGAALYNKTSGDVRLAALNTLGVLYVIESGDTVNSIADLSGKTIFVSGQGATPEYALGYILEKNGITDCTIEWVADHATLATMCASGEVSLALLPEPFVTSVLMKNAESRIAIDLTKEWKNVSDTSELTMGCIVVSSQFAQNNKAALDSFLKEYANSVAYVNANVEQAAALVEAYGIMPSAQAAQKAIPNCNIVCITGEEMKQTVAGFYDVLFAFNPKSVGGKLPDEAFYYIG